MEVGQQLAVLLGGVVTGLLALARLTIGEQRNLVQQFMRFVGDSIERQEASSERMARSLADLSEGTRENTATLRRMGEQLGVRFSQDEGVSCR